MAPNGGQQGFGQVVTFDIPAYGIIESLIFTTKFTFGAASGAENAYRNTPILELMEYMEIASQNKIISRITRDEYVGFLSRMDRGEAAAFAAYAKTVTLAKSSNTTIGSDVGIVRETEQTNVSVTAGKEAFLPWVGMLSGIKSEFSSRLDSS